MTSANALKSDAGGCLHVVLSGDLSGLHASSYAVDFQWIDGQFAADVILDLAGLNNLNDSCVEVLRAVCQQLDPHGARVLACNVPNEMAEVLEQASLPCEIVYAVN